MDRLSTCCVWGVWAVVYFRKFGYYTRSPRFLFFYFNLARMKVQRYIDWCDNFYNLCLIDGWWIAMSWTQQECEMLVEKLLWNVMVPTWIGKSYKSRSTKHLVISYDIVLGSNHNEKFSDWLDYKRNLFELQKPWPKLEGSNKCSFSYVAEARHARFHALSQTEGYLINGW